MRSRIEHRAYMVMIGLLRLVLLLLDIGVGNDLLGISRI